MFDNLPLLANVALFIASAGAVWQAGSRLARTADKLAAHTGWGQAAVGMLLLGAITSLPELAVAMTATLEGSPILSVNDVLGSASINVLILAIADAAYGRKALTASPGTPEVLLQGALSILLLSMVAAAHVSGDRLLLGMGRWSWIILFGYMAALLVLTQSRNLRSWVPEDSETKAPANADDRKQDATPLGPLAIRVLILACVIVAGGFLLARSADALADQTGLGTGFVGVVLLAGATSLPEASTALAAVRLGRAEMAIADMFGTNLFNVTIIVLVDALHPGAPILVEAGRFAAFAALLALALTTLFLVGLTERRDKTVMRMGVDSILAVVLYLAGVVVLYHLR